MRLHDTGAQQIKKEIWKYYQNKKAIEGQKNRLGRLHAKLKSIQNDINNPSFNHSFKTDLKGVSYDSIIVSGGSLPSSCMDREIEHIYQELERDYKNTENEILRTKALIRKLEDECSDMDFYIGMLSDECNKILDMKYRKKKSLYQISAAMNMSEATVSRTLSDIMRDISKIKEIYKNRENS